MSERTGQCDRILRALQSGPQTSRDLQELGICSHTSRISELRKRGHVIVATEKRIGRKRIVVYRLKGQLKLFGEAA